jgi:hypothetical protein
LLAEQGKRLFGDAGAQFTESLKGAASFPLAVVSLEPPQGDLALRVRFYPFGGTEDQGAGLAWGIGADGSYWGVRANALENNLLFFHVVKGVRSVLADIPNVPTATKTWHELALTIKGKQLDVDVDGVRKLDKALDHAPEGRVGLWSKADSQVLFDDFVVGVP